jgi:hypothetical protein
MSLRATLKAAVARCAHLPMQHATFGENAATADATGVQPKAGNPHETRLSRATTHATRVQPGPETDATLGVELHVARTSECNTQLGSLTAHRVTAELLAAAVRACDFHGDSPAAGEQMRADCLATPPHLRADLLAHFTTTYPKT